MFAVPAISTRSPISPSWFIVTTPAALVATTLAVGTVTGGRSSLLIESAKSAAAAVSEVSTENSELFDFTPATPVYVKPFTVATSASVPSLNNAPLIASLVPFEDASVVAIPAAPGTVCVRFTLSATETAVTSFSVPVLESFVIESARSAAHSLSPVSIENSVLSALAPATAV